MPHSFDAFGTPRATLEGGPRDVSRARESTALAADRERIGLFHVTRSEPSKGTPEEAALPVHLTRVGVQSSGKAFFDGTSMNPSPVRPKSPPLLFRRNSTGSQVTPAASGGVRRHSFEGGSMVFVTSAEERADEARASAEVQEWLQQQARANEAPAAGASSSFAMAYRCGAGRSSSISGPFDHATR